MTPVLNNSLLVLGFALTGLANAVTPSVWNDFNRTLNGRLSIGNPLAIPCFSSTDVEIRVTGQNSTECANIMKNYLNQPFRVEQFGAFMNTQWETCQSESRQCLLDSDDPSDPVAFSAPNFCDQGSIPQFYINASSASDVIQAFKFSKTTGFPLTIKSTGHDYTGRSSGRNTLSLWMRGFNSMNFDPSFIPKGCPASKAKPGATIGASVVFDTVYEFAEANNITLPGGAGLTVAAAGGYLQGGGHGALSNVFGLAVDRVLEFEVVTPTGLHIFANECQFSDLFFALRGGGGGAFGAVLQVTTLALPQMSLPTIFAQFPETRAAQRKFLNFITERSVQYANEGWGGFINPTANLIYTNPLLNMSAATKNMQDLRTFITDELNGNFSLTLQPSYLSFFNTFLAPNQVPVGFPFAVASRLIPSRNFETNESRSQLIDALIPAVDEAQLPLIFVVAPFFFGDKGGTSVTPAWRNSLWHVTVSDVWNFDTTLEERQGIYSNLTHSLDKLRQLTPGSGAYQNEADVYEPDFQESFWGANYPRLLEIKQKYDPDHILDCWHCVGWLGAENERYSCYPPL